VRIQTSSGLTEQEKEQMIKDAQLHEEEDKKRKEEIEIRNQADALVYQTEKNLKEYGDKIEPDEKGRINNALEELKKAQGTSDIQSIKNAMENMNKVWSEISSKMYERVRTESASASGGTTNDTSAGSPKTKEESKGDDIEDADFEVVDDKK
jgi:molecular chaperone DnaK